MNNKKNKSRAGMLAKKMLNKKIAKANKAGNFLYKCIGGADQPNGCGNEWTQFCLKGHPQKCPKCENKYFKWLNYKE